MHVFSHLFLLFSGSTLLAVFGLPPSAHENDPARGLLCSLRMQKLMLQQHIPSSIGVTSGLALCGLVGSAGSRREYSVLGDVVNQSARLMQAAGGGLLNFPIASSYSTLFWVSFLFFCDLLTPLSSLSALAHSQASCPHGFLFPFDLSILSFDLPSDFFPLLSLLSLLCASCCQIFSVIRQPS